MEKIINIGDKAVKLSNNVAWTMEYRDQFGRDVLPSLIPLVTATAEGLAAVIADTGTSEPSIQDIADAIRGNTMDIVLPMAQLEFVDIAVNVTWAMAKAADADIDPPKVWVRQFDEFPLDIIIPELYDLVICGFASSKNRERLKKTLRKVKDLQPKK